MYLGRSDNSVKPTGASQELKSLTHLLQIKSVRISMTTIHINCDSMLTIGRNGLLQVLYFCLHNL